MKIISSNYVPCEKPYQVIEYAGYVGMQIGTLIVTEENPGNGGRYGILSHCHPVVSYTRKMNSYGTYPVHQFFAGGFAECAVWDNVELSEVIPVCIVPDTNKVVEISYDSFLSLMTQRDYNRIRTLRSVFADYSLEFSYSVKFALAKLGISVRKEHVFKRLDLRITKEALWNPSLNENGSIEEGSIEFCYVDGLKVIQARTIISDTQKMTSDLVRTIDIYLEVLGNDFPLHFFTNVPEFEELAQALNDKYGEGSNKG